MLLSKDQKKFVERINKNVLALLDVGCSEEALLVELWDLIPHTKHLLKKVSHQGLKELETNHAGFAKFLMLIK